MIGRLFPEVYRRVRELGMIPSTLTNGSRLSSPALLGLLTASRPYRITISVYGPPLSPMTG
jgi:hypothetical protein